MTTDEDRHMPWPDHTHNQHGECQVEMTLRDGAQITAAATLTGLPCDSCSIEVSALLTTPAEVVWLRRTLDLLETLLIEGTRDADCVGHDHG